MQLSDIVRLQMILLQFEWTTSSGLDLTADIISGVNSLILRVAPNTYVVQPQLVNTDLQLQLKSFNHIPVHHHCITKINDWASLDLCCHGAINDWAILE